MLISLYYNISSFLAFLDIHTSTHTHFDVALMKPIYLSICNTNEHASNHSALISIYKMKEK